MNWMNKCREVLFFDKAVYILAGFFSEVVYFEFLMYCNIQELQELD